MKFSEDHCILYILEYNNLQEDVCTKFVRSVGFEVLAAVAMESTIFWDVTPCRLVEVHRRLGGKYCVLSSLLTRRSDPSM
jgi:hypothetical protein